MQRAKPAQLFAHIKQSVVGGLGACSPRKKDHMRVLKPSETTITMQNLRQLDFNFGNSSCGHVSEPIPFEINHCVVQPLSLGSCIFECFTFAGHEAVTYMKMCAVSE